LSRIGMEQCLDKMATSLAETKARLGASRQSST
jgi:hypothetical protein